MTDVVMPQMGESIVEGTLTKWLQEARRARGAGRAAVRDFDRQGRHGNSVARRRNAGGDPGGGREDGRDQYGGRRGSMRAAATARAPRAPAKPQRQRRLLRRRLQPPPARPPRSAAPSLAPRNRRAGSSARRLPLPTLTRTSRRSRRAAFAAGAEDGAREQYRSEPGERHRRGRAHHQAGSSRRIWRSGRLRPPRQQRRRRRACAARCAAAATGSSACRPTCRRPRRRPAKVRVEPMSTMRQKIAEHMVMSKRTSAHVTTIHKVDMTKVAKVRDRQKADFQARYGLSLTYLPFVVRAAVEALRTLSHRERIHRRHQHPLSQRNQYRHCRGAGERPDRAGDPQRRREERAGAAARHRGSGGARAVAAAQARRSAGRHVLHHQFRQLRQRRRDAGHQPAAGGDSGSGRGGERRRW